MTNKPLLIIWVSAVSVILFMVSCGNVQEEMNEEAEEIQDTGMHYGNDNANFPKLLPEAQSEVANWSVFDDFQVVAEGMSGSTREELKSKTERLLLHTDSLSKQIPNVLYIQPIVARLSVVKSRTLLLQQDANNTLTDSLTIVKQLEEFNKAVSNLYVQINEKIEKDKIDIQREEDEQKELEKQKRFLDSVYQAEKADMERQ